MQARRKFKAIEQETEKGSSVFKDHVSGLAEKVLNCYMHLML